MNTNPMEGTGMEGKSSYLYTLFECFLVLPSLHLFTFFENVFLYLFLSIFSYKIIYINVMHTSILVKLIISRSQAGNVNKVRSDPEKMYTSCQDHCVLYIRCMLYI